MNHVKSVFFGCIFLSLFSCTDNSSTDQQTTSIDSQSQRIKHEDLHVQYHDTTKGSHNGDVGLVEILPDMISHIRSIHKTNTIERDFVTVLNTFHQAEMEMAYIELDRGKNAELKSLAADIKSNSLFSNLDLYYQRDSTGKTDLFYKEITHVLRKQHGPENSMSKSIDSQFAFYLQYHHERALEIIPVFFKYCTNKQLVLLVNKIDNIYKNR